MPELPDPLLRVPHLYHFTNVRNLPKIKELDGIYSTAKLKEMGVAFQAGGDEQSLPMTAVGVVLLAAGIFEITPAIPSLPFSL
jgi:hypothetical protein